MSEMKINNTPKKGKISGIKLEKINAKDGPYKMAMS